MGDTTMNDPIVRVLQAQITFNSILIGLLECVILSGNEQMSDEYYFLISQFRDSISEKTMRSDSDKIILDLCNDKLCELKR